MFVLVTDFAVRFHYFAKAKRLPRHVRDFRRVSSCWDNIQELMSFSQRQCVDWEHGSSVNKCVKFPRPSNDLLEHRGSHVHGKKTESPIYPESRSPRRVIFK